LEGKAVDKNFEEFDTISNSHDAVLPFFIVHIPKGFDITVLLTMDYSLIKIVGVHDAKRCVTVDV
jgi:hypothetical protein